MDLQRRALLHRMLGDELRLRVVDALYLGDRTSSELVRELGVPSNLLAHHLRLLAESGLITARPSEGDGRRRYISLQREALPGLAAPPITARRVLFTCTHNSARSQFAEAAFARRSGLDAESAGTLPTERVHPKAVAVGAELGFDLEGRRPKSYDAVRNAPDLVISVCDRAREAPNPFEAPLIHWSVADPVAVDRLDAFRTAFRQIDERVDQLIEAIRGGNGQ